jgi:hypothetical protein
MLLNHITLSHMTKLRMKEDQRAAEGERFIHPNIARLDLLIWQERVGELIDNLEALRKDLQREKSSLPDST